MLSFHFPNSSCTAHLQKLQNTVEKEDYLFNAVRNIKVIERAFNRKRGRRKKRKIEVNSNRQSFTRKRTIVAEVTYVCSPLTKLAFALAWYNGQVAESIGTNRDIKVVSVSIPRVLENFFPPGPPILPSKLYFPRINICNGVSRESPHRGRIERKTHRWSTYCFLSIIANPSSWICR